MTDPSHDSFEALRLSAAPLATRPAAARDLRSRLHRRLGFDQPDGEALPRVDGVEYEVAGDPDGDPVLFMHAGIATAFSALLEEPALAGYRLVRYHRRGFAGSVPFEADLTIGQQVDDAVAILDHLAIDRAHIVGHSGSGVLAFQTALDAPDRVLSLVLEEPAFHSIDPRWQTVVNEAIAFPVERYRAGDSRGAIEMWMESISSTWRADLTRTVPGGPQQMLEDAAAFFAEVDLVVSWTFDHERAARLAAPVLHLLGADSPTRASAVVRRFQEIVPHTELAVIPGAGHMLHTDQPRLVAEELARFFARHGHRP